MSAAVGRKSSAVGHSKERRVRSPPRPRHREALRRRRFGGNPATRLHLLRARTGPSSFSALFSPQRMPPFAFALPSRPCASIPRGGTGSSTLGTASSGREYGQWPQRTDLPLRAAKAASCAQLNSGYGANSGASRGRPLTSAFRPLRHTVTGRYDLYFRQRQTRRSKMRASEWLLLGTCALSLYGMGQVWLVQIVKLPALGLRRR